MKGIYWLGLGIVSLQAFFINPCFAQSSNIVPDNSLGAESSRVIENSEFKGLPVEEIKGGARRGINLFHSFREFNVSEGRGAYFSSPDAEIQNILARVTGSNRSDILGTLGALGGSQPNLFLINPNGIVFGENASLDVGGSFVATTANGVQFGERGVFSATSPQSPSQLLTINPSALFFNQIANQSINSIESRGFLSVPESKSLLFVGGNISPNPVQTGGILLSGGRLRAGGGKIELGGLGSTGTVELNFSNTGLSLKFPSDVPRIDVDLKNLAEVDVTSGGGGSITINARNINILDGSDICAGIGATTSCGSQTINFGAVNRQAGNITLKALETINISGRGSIVENNVNPRAIGNSGDINIKAKFVVLNDGSFLSNNTFGNGNAGNVVINAQDRVSFNQAVIISRVWQGGVGRGGDIRINTGLLELYNGSQLSSSTFGRGNAGNIVINAQDRVSFNQAGIGIASRVRQGGVGRGGDIRITTGLLELYNGSQLSSATFGRGNAGNIVIEAPKGVLIEGRTEDTDTVFSGIFSTAEDNALGSAGNIDIQTSTLQMRNLAAIASDTEVEGNAGNINIRAQDITIVGGGRPFALTGILSRVLFGGNGLGGNIDIETGTLQILNGAEISTGVAGVGISGDVRIKAQAITLAGTNPDEIFPQEFAGSKIVSRLGISFGQIDENGVITRFGIGKAGDIEIQTGTLVLRDSSEINASTAGDGDGGNVRIIAENIDFDGGKSLITATFGFGLGNAGDIDIETGSLRLSNGSQLSAFTEGRGLTGNIRITAKDIVEIKGSNLVGEPLPSALFTDNDTDSNGVGGNITVTTNRFRITDGAIVDARTRNEDKGGNITINTNTFEALRGGQIITNSLGSGKSGTITINATERFLIDGVNPNYATRRAQFDNRVGAVDAASGLFVISQGNGSAGDIFVKTPNIQLDNRGKINAESNNTDGGNISLDVQDILLLRRNSSISATAGVIQGAGNGGNININSKFIVAVPKENSDITANAFSGTGGNLDITSQGIFGIEPRQQANEKTNDITASSDLGIPGNINLNSPDTSSIQNSLDDLPDNQIDTNALIANSCIARSTQRQENSFTITGSGGLRNSPGDRLISIYSTGDVRNVETTPRPWKKGDPIIEPTGVYKLPDGRLLLSRKCRRRVREMRKYLNVAIRLISSRTNHRL